jgi:hypothetical protein
VWLLDKAQFSPPECPVVAKFMTSDDRPVEAAAIEGVGEPGPQFFKVPWAGKQRHGGAERCGERAKLVQAVAMVSVGVRDNYRIDAPDFCGEHLLAQVGPAIDQQPLIAALDQDR